MPFTALEFDTDAADLWSDALLEAGALAVDAADPGAGTPDETPLFGEPGEPGVAPWSTSRLTALFTDDAAASAALAQAADALGRAAPACRRTHVEDQDWVRATQAQFGPIAIGDRLVIVPSWCAAPNAGAVAITLDPGLAFGTGSHPTTRLCLEWLQHFLERGATVLDYGCGSGILAIAAMKLGAREVVGTDVDAQAIRASHDNARGNAVEATFVVPDALAMRAFDVVVANILANPLILLAPVLAARVRPGGRIALSGILESQAADVIAAYTPWFTLRAWRASEGWVLLAGERTAGTR
jgi:ribosomal protein L11 methyltransferase